MRNVILRARRNGLARLEEELRSAFRDRPVRLDVGFVGGPYVGQPGAVDESAQQSLTALPDQTLVVRLSPSHANLAAIDNKNPRAPCVECFERRSISLLTKVEQWAFQRGERGVAVDAPLVTPATATTIGLVARTLVSRNTSDSSAAVASIDLAGATVTNAELLQDSFCTNCSDEPPSSRPQTFAFRESLISWSGSGHLLSPSQLKLPERALINRVCGVLGPDPSRGYAQSVTAPVFGQYLQRARNGPPYTVGWSGLRISQAESLTAAMLEGLERQAGMQPPSPSRIPVQANYKSVRAEAMDPTLCFAYNDESYDRSLGLTRFTGDLELEWVWGYSLVSKRPMLVPRQLAFYAKYDRGMGAKVLDNNSSGCALGSCYEEAILKALCELIERDSFVIAWHRQLSFARIDGSTCDDFTIRSLLDRLWYGNFEVRLLDARLDLAIPVVIATIRRRDTGLGAFVVGASSAMNPMAAIRGALLEAASAIVEMPAMVRRRERHLRELLADYYRVVTVMDHSMLYGLPEMSERIRWFDGSRKESSFAELFPEHSRGPVDIAAQLQSVIQQLTARGLDEIVAVDQTTTEQAALGLKTVRVIVPGLAPIDFGHPRNRVERLNRLRTAPAVAGFARPNYDRNPLPHPFP